MSDDRTSMTIPRNAHTAMIDALQRAVIDRGAAKATREAAFSALVALVDEGLIRDTSTAEDGIASAPAPAMTGLRLMG